MKISLCPVHVRLYHALLASVSTLYTYVVTKALCIPDKKCRNIDSLPLEGECLNDNFVYQVTVKNSYKPDIGKQRFYNHKSQHRHFPDLFFFFLKDYSSSVCLVLRTFFTNT